MILIFHSIPKASTPREKYSIGSEAFRPNPHCIPFLKKIKLSLTCLQQHSCTINKVEVSILSNQFQYFITAPAEKQQKLEQTCKFLHMSFPQKVQVCSVTCLFCYISLAVFPANILFLEQCCYVKISSYIDRILLIRGSVNSGAFLFQIDQTTPWKNQIIKFSSRSMGHCLK